ncbi:unnamed protein product [Ranitomeya imitator]|uniref:Transposase Tc1-like domain-containing protein n=1 Tax=Ranitomeya imitator TaxID=111125 RepID=A0ABN9LUH7_9NEOB|nr:unnamed protein product [Ranitomeya imitator]
MQVKQAILKLRKQKKPIREIATILGVAKSTVWYILRKKESTGELINAKRPGRPRKTTVVDDRRIISMVKRNPFTTANQVNHTLQEVGVSISKSIIKSKLHESKYRGFTAQCKPLISIKNKKARLDFAIKHLKKPVQFWKNILWTDETKINLYQRRGLLQGDPVPGNTPLVINISSKTLSIAEHSVLQKGLSFCPSYKFDTFTMDMDLHRFFRRLRLLVHFDSSEMSPVTTSDTPRSLISSQSLGLRNKSTYRPRKSSHAVEAFIGIIEQSFSRLRQDIETHKLHTSTNLSTPDFQALQTLRTDNEIVIKPADKGGAIVIMNKSDYTQEIHRQLRDNTVYRLLPTDPTTMIRNLIKETLDPYVEKGVIDGKTQEYLTKDFPITPVFYILPKIHKNLEHPPGRPIVASTESILSPLAIFLEKILTPLVRTSPSFLLDTASTFMTPLRYFSKIFPQPIFYYLSPLRPTYLSYLLDIIGPYVCEITSVDILNLNPIEHAFHLLKSRLKTERPTNKPDLKAAAVKAWQSIKKEETQRLVMSMGSRLKAVIASKGFATKY